MSHSHPPADTSRWRLLTRRLTRLRRKELLVSLARVLLLSVAADMGYDLLGIGLFTITGKSIYYPPFFAVVFALLTLRVFAATTMPVFARRLDQRHRLKDRLSSHLAYRDNPSVPAEIAEAQAAETLSTVDFAKLSRGLAVRPWGLLAVIALFTIALWFLLWRHPYATPQNFAFRHGAQMASLVRGLLPAGHPPIPRMTAGNDQQKEDPPERESPPSGKGEKGERREMPPPGEKERTQVNQPGQPPATTPTPLPEATPPPAGTTQEAKSPSRSDQTKGETGEQPEAANRRGSAFNAQSRMRITSRETTRKTAPLTSPPPRPLIPPPGLSSTGGTRAFLLPPLPRLSLADRLPGRDILLDPDTVYVSPDGYSGKYHDLILAYYRELLALKGEEHGSY
jgi:hypothetical protein